MIDQVYGHLTAEFRAEQMARIKFDFLSGDHQKSLGSPSGQPVQQLSEEPAKPAIKAVVKPAPQPA
jgi:hypothetical protein